MGSLFCLCHFQNGLVSLVLSAVKWDNGGRRGPRFFVACLRIGNGNGCELGFKGLELG